MPDTLNQNSILLCRFQNGSPDGMNSISASALRASFRRVLALGSNAARSWARSTSGLRKVGKTGAPPISGRCCADLAMLDQKLSRRLNSMFRGGRAVEVTVGSPAPIVGFGPLNCVRLKML